MPKIKSPKQVEEIENEKRIVFSLKNADRPLDEKELEAEEKATKYPRLVYKRIPPIPGTLAFALRNLKGGNESVIEFLRWAQEGEHSNRTRFIKEFIILWEVMDEFSRRRIDIFDHLCRKYSIPLKRFWGVLQEGLFDHYKELAQTALGEGKLELIENVKKFAGREKGHQDRKLLADMCKLTSEAPLIKVEDNSKHLTLNNNGIPSFVDSIRRTEKVVRHNEELPKPLELTEGETEYIDAETFENEKELSFVKAAREL